MMRFPCQVSSDVKFTTFRSTTFAAQIVCPTGRNAPAPEASGWLSAQHELRSSRKGPRPSMSRLVDEWISFHCFVGLKIVRFG